MIGAMQRQLGIDPNYQKARPMTCPVATYKLLLDAEVGISFSFTNKAGFVFRLSKQPSSE
jgi:hypothetical protein